MFFTPTCLSVIYSANVPTNTSTRINASLSFIFPLSTAEIMARTAIKHMIFIENSYEDLSN